MERKYNITRKQLKRLGFKKVVVTPEETGDDRGFFYYDYDFKKNEDDLYAPLSLITCTDDEAKDKKYFEVSIFDYPDFIITDVKDLKILIKMFNKIFKIKK